MWFSRRRINLGHYIPPKSWPQPTTADSVEDAMLVAGAAVRMGIKNLLIIRALQQRLDYSQETLREAVRQEIENLAAEKDADADRVRSQIESATGRAGKARHQSDYRDADITVLTRRLDVLVDLADELRVLAADDQRASSLIESAKQDALDEVLGALVTAGAEVRLTKERDPDEWAARRALLLEDLEELRG